MKTNPQTLRKITRRIIPLIIVAYFVTFLDRINIGVAAVQMNKDLGLTATAFGLGSGLFFVTYFLFEVPSNLLMHRFGARVWIPRILITIGIVGAATALITGPKSFYTVRLLLGVAEAGAAPAYVFYLYRWFPPAVRPRAYAYYFLAIPLASIIGGPAGGLFLNLNGVGGLRGWQWVFVFPGLLTVLLGAATYFVIPNDVTDVKWLTPKERTVLAEDIDNGNDLPADHAPGLRKQLFQPLLLGLLLIIFVGNFAMYVLSFFLPQIIKALGVSDFSAAALSAVPYTAAGLALLYFGRRSTRYGATRLNLGLGFGIGVVGFAVAGVSHNPTIVLCALCLGAIGGLGYLPAFWTLPPRLYSGATLAAVVAGITSFSALGGLIGPPIMGYLRDQTHSFGAGLVFCAVVVAAGAVVSMFAGRRPASERTKQTNQPTELRPDEPERAH